MLGSVLSLERTHFCGGFRHSVCICLYVVVNFLSQVIFIFPLFLGMVIYANEFETKEKKTTCNMYMYNIICIYTYIYMYNCVCWFPRSYTWAKLSEGRLALIQGYNYYDNSYVLLTVNPGLVLIRL